MNHEYLTVRDVAQLLKVNSQTVRRWIWNGKLPYIKVGQTVRVPKSELDGMVTRGQKRVQDVMQSPEDGFTSVNHVELQTLAESVLAQLDAACEQIRAHVGEVEDSVNVLARVRESSASNE
ncbi:helix-turn-helix domain-containing protein [bacterium]|nr:helix-turn-helix domain-containing protein [bacterium]